MRLPCAVVLLLVSLLTGCATTRGVRLETGSGEVIAFTPRAADSAPVALDEDEFMRAMGLEGRGVRLPVKAQEAARRLFEMGARGGEYRFDARTRRVTPLESGAHLEVEATETERAMTRAYLEWCERTGRRGDCLQALVDGTRLEGDGRYALAMALAHGAVLEEMLEAFQDMADPSAMVAAAMWTGTMYLILWTVPEPVSKGLAAVMTATLIAYLGVDTFWSLTTGFTRLMEEADRARTFDELRVVGERYGKVMGRDAARAFALLATVAIGNTAAGFAGKVPMLPGSAQASVQAASQAGVVLSAVGEVRAVAVVGEVVTLAVAADAVSATAQGLGGAVVGPVDAKGHDHHIATDKWWEATYNDGPWSPKFQEVFDQAGMSLNDPANIVRVAGHKGPHPEEYHQRILDRLQGAMRGCGTMLRCRDALTEELKRLARQIGTPGTRLNALVTRRE
ncbi:AHH domain-containing protein [Myxococcus sp. CA051A]|uniref:AHH domain-containing protein n=1 Tax=unclassified Myxococcus TaxID=2648731 RepID=UPI00157A7320|nr:MULTISPECIES: AHH domain-containing protein [unclassified Myxococcus]NTX39292.1 AHH domain-containing protein [Myxococcus sp. CA033]NTX65547.1 AHH domain-containing protein [Myxococcus sp. CA051A]